MSAIRTVDLTRTFDDFTANDRINLTVEPQEIKCIVGENGAGKTTLMNMLYGVLKPTAGQIYLYNQPVSFQSPLDAMEKHIGMVHQHFKLVASLTVYENILLGVELKRIWRGRATPLIDREAEIRTVEALIETYHFQLDAREKVANLSVGLCQQVEILKMLYRNVDILILDEPTSVLTPQEVDMLILKLKALRDAGKTIIVITHKLREVMALSDSVTVIRQGRVVGDVKTKDTNERALAQMMVGARRGAYRAKRQRLPLWRHARLCRARPVRGKRNGQAGATRYQLYPLQGRDFRHRGRGGQRPKRAGQGP